MYSTRILADYVSALHPGALSADTRAAALRCILDLLAAASSGYQSASAVKTRIAARELFGDGCAAIWFSSETMTAAGAVFCNSTAASALDLDDGNRAARGHPGAAVIPVALAFAAETGASAEEFITAIVAGYEVGVRVAMARNAANAVSRQSGRWSGYAAVATAGRLCRTSPEQMAHAFAIAGVTAPNQEANGSSGYSRLTGNDVKEGIPWSSVAGIAALQLAEAGFTGPEDILDHDSHFSYSQLLDGLGRNPRICATYFKPYSCCRYNHGAIGAFVALLAEHHVSPDEIVSVDIHTFGWALKLGNSVEPRNLVDAQYSIPYCMGVAAVLGEAALLPLEVAVLNRPEVIALARKVKLHIDPDLDSRFPNETLARVVITTAIGRFASPITSPRGEADNPMSNEDLREKFLVATRNIMPVQRQQLLLDGVDRLAHGDLAPLLQVLEMPVCGDDRQRDVFC